MFHLVTHAFFKALLFLSAGSIILGLERGHHHLAHHGHTKESDDSSHRRSQETSDSADHHEEVFDPNDMRNMGGLRKTMPVTFWLYMIGTLALAGIFPFAGFWSKDEILADAFREGYTTVYWMLSIAAFFTAFYMGRQIWMVFFGGARHEAAAHAEESPKIITAPLMVLAALSVLGGALNLPGAHTLTHWLEHTIEVHAGEFVMSVALISTALALTGVFVSWLIYGRNPLKAGQPDPLKRPLGFLFTGMEHKWFVDEGYSGCLCQPLHGPVPVPGGCSRLAFLARLVPRESHCRYVQLGQQHRPQPVCGPAWHRCFSQWPRHANAKFIGEHAQGPEWIRAQLCAVRIARRGSYSWVSITKITTFPLTILVPLPPGEGTG
jgi:NADH-quinone oxidoreductase subunit L